MKKYVVEIVEKVVYKVECSDISKEYAEKFARTMYDFGQLEGTGELESVSFDVVEEKNGDKNIETKTKTKIIDDDDFDW